MQQTLARLGTVTRGAAPRCPTRGQGEITWPCIPSVSVTWAAQVSFRAAEWASLHREGRRAPDSGHALGVPC